MSSEPTANRDLLAIALQYAGRGWPVFTISRGKVPFKGTHGHLDASTDQAVVTAMFEERPYAQLAMATGAIVVFDCDGREGWQKFKDFGPVVPTRVVGTPRGGFHFYYRAPPDLRIGCKLERRAAGGLPGLDLKGYGGYVMLPPSRTRNGRYKVLRDLPIADIPPHLIEAAKVLGATSSAPARPTIAVPAHITALQLPHRLADRPDDFTPELTDHEFARVRSACLKIGNSIGYDGFVSIGFSLHSLNWLRPDGSDAGFDIYVQWGALFPETFNLAGLEKKWESFGRTNYHGQRIGIGTLFKMAAEAGWDGTVEPPPSRSPPAEATAEPKVNGHSYELPPEFLAKSIIFPETDAKGKPKPTCINTRHAIEGLGIVCRKDVFHGRFMVGGHVVEAYAGDLTDEAVQMLRVAVWEQYKFDPGERNARDAAVQLCLQNQFDPVCDYLAGLRWDGRRRLERWVVDYLGAQDTELHREFGKLMLVAAVRRARVPGTKFDQIIVLEGPQNQGKSTAIKILAGADNFSDQNIFNASDREQQEASCGVWIHEIAELEGLARAAVQKIKQFARRTEDRARPAYGRFRIDAKRRGIFTATTNETAYLKEYDRAFWPIACGAVDLEGLAAARDQIWAEAAFLESKGHPIYLSRALYDKAKEITSERQEVDSWEDSVASAIGTLHDISINEILAGKYFMMRQSEINQLAQNRIARILKSPRFGFERYRKRPEMQWRYRKVGTGNTSGN